MWSKLVRTESQDGAYVTIPPARVLGAAPATTRFLPHRSYFEIRLKHMLLQDQREYFREFIPLASFNTEFLFGGERVNTPLVVGPSMLSNVQRVSQGDRVEFLNTRLVGPCPYEGDDLELFAGLFRLTTNDWAKQALSLLEVLTKTFDTSKLSSAIKLASPLASGIEGFFGMKDVEFRLGKHLSFSAPSIELRDGQLQPVHVALLRLPRAQLNTEQAARFWVREGRLCYGASEAELEPFTGCDFLLLDISPLAARSDYSSFDFHRKHWRKIEDLLAVQKTDEARAAFKLLAASIAQCDDIVRSHRFALLKQYKAWIDDSIAAYAQLFDLGPADSHSALPLSMDFAAPAPGAPPPQAGAAAPAPPAGPPRPKAARGPTRSASQPERRSPDRGSAPISEDDLAAAVADIDVPDDPSPEQIFSAMT